MADEAPAPDPFFNPIDPDCLADPFPSYRRLRDQDPVHWHEALGAWLVTRYDDCVSVLSDSGTFTTDFRKIGLPTPPELLSLQTIDPPEQLPLRRVGHQAIRSQDMARLDDQINERARTLWAACTARGTFDFIRDFADPLTLGTMADLCAVDGPTVDEHFHTLNDELDRSMDSGVDPDGWDDGLRARAAFNELVEQWLREAPPGTLLGYLVAHEPETEVSHEMIVNSVRAFFHAGFEVPSRFLGNAALALLQRPHLAATFGPDTIGPAVEELLRFGGPVQALSRAVTADSMIGEQLVREGDVAVALIAAANRDPAHFVDPEEVVLDRKPNPHISFGRGPHSCMGLQIARMETRAVLRVLGGDRPALELAGEPDIRPNATLRGLRHLPVAATTVTAGGRS